MKMASRFAPPSAQPGEQMRRELWVLETKGKNGTWGRTEHVGITRGSIDPLQNPILNLDGQPGQCVQYRMVKYVPRDKRPWWKFWTQEK